MNPDTPQNLYRIGTVSSLTGISVERLRAWERRYDLSPAHKSGKTRYYSRAQLERLRLVKHLIDLGQPISSLATLSTDQLKSRIDDHNPAAKRLDVVRKPAVALIGPNLLMLEQQIDAGESRLEISARWANIEAFANEQTQAQSARIIIVQLPILEMQPIDLIKDLFPEARVIAVYQFATEQTVSDFGKSEVQTLRWPVSWAEIEHVAISELGLPNRADHALPRRYSDEELIAVAATVDDGTNCPQYLVEAIHQLNAFSLFAADASHSTDRPIVYERLRNDASQARAQLEQALDRLMQELTTHT